MVLTTHKLYRSFVAENIFAELALDGFVVCSRRVSERGAQGGFDGERAQAPRSGLGAVPERNCLPHRPPHGPQTRASVS